MFCPKCGKQVDDRAVICVGCGQPLKAVTETGRVSAGWWWLGFFLPMIGFILWIVWTGEQPQKAKRVGIGALVGVIVTVLLAVLLYASFVGVLVWAVMQG